MEILFNPQTFLVFLNNILPSKQSSLILPFPLFRCWTSWIDCLWPLFGASIISIGDSHTPPQHLENCLYSRASFPYYLPFRALYSILKLISLKILNLSIHINYGWPLKNKWDVNPNKVKNPCMFWMPKNSTTKSLLKPHLAGNIVH